MLRLQANLPVAGLVKCRKPGRPPLADYESIRVCKWVASPTMSRRSRSRLPLPSCDCHTSAIITELQRLFKGHWASPLTCLPSHVVIGDNRCIDSFCLHVFPSSSSLLDYLDSSLECHKFVFFGHCEPFNHNILF